MKKKSIQNWPRSRRWWIIIRNKAICSKRNLRHKKVALSKNWTKYSLFHVHFPLIMISLNAAQNGTRKSSSKSIKKRLIECNNDTNKMPGNGSTNINTKQRVKTLRLKFSIHFCPLWSPVSSSNLHSWSKDC